MTEHAELHLAIAYLGVQTFRIKDVKEFLKDSDVKHGNYSIIEAMKEMGCHRISNRSNQTKWCCPGIPKIGVVLDSSDLTGERFGRWTVIESAGRDENGRRRWLCKCDCGTERVIPQDRLKSGNSKSCGCLQREVASERAKKGIRKRREVEL